MVQVDFINNMFENEMLKILNDDNECEICLKMKMLNMLKIVERDLVGCSEGPYR